MKVLKFVAALLLLAPLSQSAWADLCIDPTTGGWATCSASATGPLGAPGAIGNGTPSTGAFTTLSATGQITSTLANGTAPFVVASSTNVANLNAATLSGATFANPGAIGAGTAAAGTFSALTVGVASSLTGIVNLKGLTSGIVSVLPQAVAGTYNFNLPTSAGSSGQPLLSAAGGSSPMTFGTLGVAAGGTGAITVQGAVQALSARYVLCSSGATVSAGADTTEDTLYDCSIPANALGPNGSIIASAFFTHTSSSNNKVLRFRYSTVSGTVVWTSTDTTTTSIQTSSITIQNKNATGSQESGINTGTLNAASSGTNQTEAVDTTAISHLVITCAKAASGEVCSMNHVLVEILYAP